MEEVWSWNFEREMSRMEKTVLNYPYISIDTEFPGFLQNSPQDSSQWERYEDLKFNVDKLKIIQVGLSFSDANGNRPISGGVWQFNFSHFDPTTDLHVSSSITLLRRNGINFEKNRLQGVDVDVFSSRFADRFLCNPNIKWITFHGIYDLAYLIKLITNKAMPSTLGGFMRAVDTIFQHVYDLKHMASFCEGLKGGKIGLERLAKILKVDRIGEAHQAGSDSLLTMCLFWKLMKKFQLMEHVYDGHLYGFTSNMRRSYFSGYFISDYDCYPIQMKSYGTVVVRCSYLLEPQWELY